MFFLTLRRRLGIDYPALIMMPDSDLLTREQMAQVLMLSPNRLSELTRAGHIQAASIKPLRYDRQHAAACYSNSYRVDWNSVTPTVDMSEQPIIRSRLGGYSVFTGPVFRGY
jgi:hypothetical protein